MTLTIYQNPIIKCLNVIIKKKLNTYSLIKIQLVT